MRSTAAVSAILAASTATQAAIIASGPLINTTVTSVPLPLSTGHSAPSSLSPPPSVHDNKTVVVVPSASAPFPTAPGSPSEQPIPPGNVTGIRTTGPGLPPVPTASNTGVTPPAIGGASMNTQNSFLAMGVALVMAALTL
ncbi:hypothetical protein E4U55_003715 [Claviceps digitariae]|nr:hypothetical protein E4U55_003715 [Claviceps digitariae]